MNGTTTSQQLLEMARVKGLALVQWEDRHCATNQLKVYENKHQVGSSSQGPVVNILDWMAPDLCSRCVVTKFNCMGIHEDRGGMYISSKMGQRSAHLEAAIEINASKQAILDTSLSVAFLTTRFRATNTDDWEKVSHLMEYLRGSRDQPFLPGRKNDGRLIYYVNMSFAVQLNISSYIGGELTMDRGCPMVASGKLKLNTKSLTES